jgi:hypothetical protein
MRNDVNTLQTKYVTAILAGLAVLIGVALWTAEAAAQIGREVSIPRHLANGDEFNMPLAELLDFGKRLFMANWTIQEGAGRPLAKGTGRELADPARPLTFPRNFNRISGPEANSCFGCHNSPAGLPGGNGDIVANVFVLGQRFDFASFDPADTVRTGGSRDERGQPVDFESIANSRSTLGVFGSGYIEMVARQMTADLRAIRDALRPGESRPLVSKGIAFGTLTLKTNGLWDVSRVEGLPYPAVYTNDGATPPDLIIRPFHQAGNLISIRQFTNTALNHHHGIQTEERFAADGRYNPVEFFRPDVDDGDTIHVEATRADVTALSLFQAAMAVPGRVIPHDAEIEAAVLAGERLFAQVGCAACHVPALPLDREGWLYSEPNPYNQVGNMRPGQGRSYMMNLNSRELPLPRLDAHDGITLVPAFTDLKLHDITAGPDDPNREPVDMQRARGSERHFYPDAFFGGNGTFITRKLWGAASKPNFYHHGKFTTMREAVLAHAGEAQRSSDAFKALAAHEQDCLIEFLKTLQVLPPGTDSLIVDDKYRARSWPPTTGRPMTTAVAERKEHHP